jgi:hypothetical protein
MIAAARAGKSEDEVRKSVDGVGFRGGADDFPFSGDFEEDDEGHDVGVGGEAKMRHGQGEEGGEGERREQAFGEFVRVLGAAGTEDGME